MTSVNWRIARIQCVTPSLKTVKLRLQKGRKRKSNIISTEKRL